MRTACFSEPDARVQILAKLALWLQASFRCSWGIDHFFCNTAYNLACSSSSSNNGYHRLLVLFGKKTIKAFSVGFGLASVVQDLTPGQSLYYQAQDPALCFLTLGFHGHHNFTIQYVFSQEECYSLIFFFIWLSLLVSTRLKSALLFSVRTPSPSSAVT